MSPQIITNFRHKLGQTTFGLKKYSVHVFEHGEIFFHGRMIRDRRDIDRQKETSKVLQSIYDIEMCRNCDVYVYQCLHA